MEKLKEHKYEIEETYYLQRPVGIALQLDAGSEVGEGNDRKQ